jgi:hypothetical protein
LVDDRIKTKPEKEGEKKEEEKEEDETLFLLLLSTQNRKECLFYQVFS